MQDENRGKREVSVSKKLFQRIFWMPFTVIILGILSLTLLILTHQIAERQNQDFSLTDALMTMRLKTATFHLWFEEGLFGDETIDMKEVWLDLDQAIHISQTILNGGEYEGREIEPLKDSLQAGNTEKITSLLTEFKAVGLERWQNPKMAGIGTALDQKFDAVYKEIEDNGKALEKVFDERQTSNHIKSRRLFWSILVTWTLIIAGVVAGLSSRELRRKQAEQGLKIANEQLQLQAVELERHRAHLLELVEERTAELTHANLSLQQEIIERKQAQGCVEKSEKQLRRLSSQLLTIHESERQRISKELHDELGGSLAGIKFRLNFMEKGLTEQQGDLRKLCEETSTHLGQVMENVRRFSRDLSPYVLNYFGLSTALQRLFTNFCKNYNVKLRHDMMDLDPFFSREAQVIIYRIFQEILTNAGKHAQATALSVAMDKRDGRIFFKLQDDGKGFDMNRTPTGNSSGKGIGLAIIEERVRMLGGTLELWSQERKGTRVTFTVPISEGENS